MGDSGYWGQNRLLFLQSKADVGDLIIVTGSSSTTGVLVSYTPISGRTFVLIAATLHGAIATGAKQVLATLRNNGTIRDYFDAYLASASGMSIINQTSVIEVDILVGDGAKTYDINVVTNGSGDAQYGTIFGYLE